MCNFRCFQMVESGFYSSLFSILQHQNLFHKAQSKPSYFPEIDFHFICQGNFICIIKKQFTNLSTFLSVYIPCCNMTHCHLHSPNTQSQPHSDCSLIVVQYQILLQRRCTLDIDFHLTMHKRFLWMILNKEYDKF